MVFKQFRIQILLRVAGIVLTSLALAWSIYETEFLMTPLVFGLFTLIQAISLILYLEKSTRLLSGFISSFSDKDYMRKFEPQYEGRAFKELSSSINQLLEEYARLTLEKEGQYQYVKLINEHVQVPLISFKPDGKIDLMNKSAQVLLGSPLLYRMEDINNYEAQFFQFIKSLPTGTKEVYKSQKLTLAVSVKKFILAERELTLVAMQDISQELQANELDAWQKLIRVLTHEIMNSMTPVLSLSTAIKKLVQDENAKPKESLEGEDIRDIHKSISSVEKRGEGLLNFVNAYRDYTKTPELHLEKVMLSSLVDDILTLFKDQFDQHRIQYDFKNTLVSEAELELDPKLITQVLINLVKNAIEALEATSNPNLEIELSQAGHNHILSVSDNGPGIPDDIKENIFVPFFTTKKLGSGIGLSLSKQIIKAHGGQLKCSPSEVGSTFKLSF